MPVWLAVCLEPACPLGDLDHLAFWVVAVEWGGSTSRQAAKPGWELEPGNKRWNAASRLRAPGGGPAWAPRQAHPAVMRTVAEQLLGRLADEELALRAQAAGLFQAGAS